MTTLDQIAQSRPATSQATAVEQARAVAEVAAAVRVAQDNPRNIARSIAQMEQACSQPALANRAFFSLPRGGSRIEGSTVHLARELARTWCNIDYGIRELRRDDDAGQSEMQAWAWDQEANVRSTRSFIVPHERMARKERQKLTDLGDIANNNNSVAARAVRETIFTVLPVWFREQAESIATRTLQDGGGKTLEQQVAEVASLYAKQFNVTAKQLEDRLQRRQADWTAQDIGGLRVLGGELARGERKASEEFPAEQLSGDAILSGTSTEAGA